MSDDGRIKQLEAQVRARDDMIEALQEANRRLQARLDSLGAPKLAPDQFARQFDQLRERALTNTPED